MLQQGDGSWDEVVLAFLRAEIASPDRGPPILASLRARGLDRASLIDAGDLSDSRANRNRLDVLGDARGGLFQGFPGDVAWRRVLVEPSDFHRLKYIGRDADWMKLSGNTRLVEQGASNLDAVPRIAKNVIETRRRIQLGDAVVALILVESDNALVNSRRAHTGNCLCDAR